MSSIGSRVVWLLLICSLSILFSIIATRVNSFGTSASSMTPPPQQLAEAISGVVRRHLDVDSAARLSRNATDTHILGNSVVSPAVAAELRVVSDELRRLKEEVGILRLEQQQANKRSIATSGAATQGSTPAKATTSTATAAAVTCPISMPNDGKSIPKVVHVTWKTSDNLPKRAQAFHEEWIVNEPLWDRRVWNDTECRGLAAQYPGLLGVFDAFKYNVMRADTCRILIVYFCGGVYMDLDVKRVRPLAEFIDRDAGILVGREPTGGFMCQWFFAGAAGHHCFASILDTIRERGRSPDYENEHVIHGVTGPAAFSAGFERCGARPRYINDAMSNRLIFHDFAHHNWRSEKGYSSWSEERIVKASNAEMGWKAFHRARAIDLLPRLPKDATRLDVRVSIGAYPVPLFPLHNAFDDDIETETIGGKKFSVMLTKPSTVGSIRVFGARAISDERFHGEGMTAGKILFFSADGAVLHEFTRTSRIGPAIWRVALPSEMLVARIEIVPMLAVISEFAIYARTSFTERYSVRISRTPPPSTNGLFALDQAMQRSTRSLIGDRCGRVIGHGFRSCTPPNADVLSATVPIESSARLRVISHGSADFLYEDSEVEVFRIEDVQPSEWHHDKIVTFAEARKPIHAFHINMDFHEWGRLGKVMETLNELQVRELFLQVHLSDDGSEGAEGKAMDLGYVQRYYELHHSIVAQANVVKVEEQEVPSVYRLSFLRRSA